MKRLIVLLLVLTLTLTACSGASNPAATSTIANTATAAADYARVVVIKGGFIKDY